MMLLKINIYIILIFPVLFGCTNEIQEEHKDEGIVISEEDSLSKVKKNNEVGKKLYPIFTVKEYCNKEDQDSVMHFLQMFEKKTPFNISTGHIDDKLKITYRVIDDCCLKFRGKASISITKLNLYHLKKTGNPCECFCMYEFEFLIRGIDMPKSLIINKYEVEIPY